MGDEMTAKGEFQGRIARGKLTHLSSTPQRQLPLQTQPDHQMTSTYYNMAGRTQVQGSHPPRNPRDRQGFYLDLLVLRIIWAIESINYSCLVVYRLLRGLLQFLEPKMSAGGSPIIYIRWPGSCLDQYKYFPGDLIQGFSAPILNAIKSPTPVDISVSGVTYGQSRVNTAENRVLRGPSDGFPEGYVAALCFMRSLWTLFVCPDFTGVAAVSGTGDTDGYAKSGAKSPTRTQYSPFVAIRVDEHLNGIRYRGRGRGS